MSSFLVATTVSASTVLASIRWKTRRAASSKDQPLTMAYVAPFAVREWTTRSEFIFNDDTPLAPLLNLWLRSSPAGSSIGQSRDLFGCDTNTVKPKVSVKINFFHVFLRQFVTLTGEVILTKVSASHNLSPSAFILLNGIVVCISQSELSAPRGEYPPKSHLYEFAERRGIWAFQRRGGPSDEPL